MEERKEIQMKYFNLLDIKLQELYVFILAAKYQSITKAAAFLYLTPSQVSKVIKKLEQLWGVQLFLREKNTIRLTPAGKHAALGFEKVIQNVEATLDETFHIQQVKPFIRIGCPTLCEPDELMPIVRRFIKQYPEASVDFECTDTLSTLREYLLDGRADIIFTAWYEVEKIAHGLRWRAVEQDPLYVIMNEEHPLASEGEIDLAEVEFEKFVLLNPATSMNTEYIISLCQTKGFIPQLACYASNIYSQIMAVYTSTKVICVQSLKGLKNTEGLCCRRLTDMSCAMGFAYRKDCAKIIDGFAQCAPAPIDIRETDQKPSIFF